MSLPLLFLAVLAFSFVFCAALTACVIPRLRAWKMGQNILEIGPAWHAPKAGTPTMGGIVFLFVALIEGALCFVLLLPGTPRDELYPFALTLGYALFNGAIGIADDLTKFRHHRNEGLTPTQKLLLQTALAAAYLSLLHLFGILETEPPIRIGMLELNIGFTSYFFFLLLLVGITNCANLTDGIDGLAASVAAVIFAILGFLSSQAEALVPLLLSTILCGIALAFLVFNRHPARIFMGDTGSLFLGAGVAAIPFLLDRPFLSLLCGIVYLVEGVSVILQVLYFKRTGKRLFLMAPIHHHFEKCGWSENKIVAVFSLCTLASCVLAAVLP